MKNFFFFDIIKKRSIICIVFFAIFLQVSSSIQAQTTEGTEFWLTFGKSTENYSSLNFQIRIVCGNQSTNGTLHFTHLGTSVNFNIGAQQVYTYSLTETQRASVLNLTTGISDNSLRITTEYPVKICAIHQGFLSTDATFLLPTISLGSDYHQISYFPGPRADAYAVVATQNNTKVSHEGNLEATLNAGQVYYRTYYTDMTGSYITADHPVAFFAVHQGTRIPENSQASDCLMEQLAPVKAYGFNYFVPVSHCSKDIVRIVASQNNTNITQTGGKLLYPQGGHTSLNNLQKGQFVELEVSLSNNGCYIQADKPVGACTYLTGSYYNGTDDDDSDPAQCLLPTTDQTVTEALITPFKLSGTAINKHYALIITPTLTKNETTVSIDGATPTTLSGGEWKDNSTAGMSFYNMPLTGSADRYLYANSNGLMALCYGTGDWESYYFLAAYSADYDLPGFYANDMYYLTLQTHTLCEGDIHFHAQVYGMSGTPGSLKWYINNIEEIPARDQLIWSKNFSPNVYNIKMMVRLSEADSVTLESTMRVGYEISADTYPSNGGSISGVGCYMMNDVAILTAVPNFGYKFVRWTENDIEISTEETISFTVTGPRHLKAYFELKTYDVLLYPNPHEGGTVSDNLYDIVHGTTVTVNAFPNEDEFYTFWNWTEEDSIFSTNASYTFEIMADRVLTANFTLGFYDIVLLANPQEGGTLSGGGDSISHGTEITVSATPNTHFNFVNWTENDTVVSTNADYTFKVVEDRTLVANFEYTTYSVTIEINEHDYGYATGAGNYTALTSAQVEAFANSCYLFNNWTLDSVIVSDENPYIFTVTDNAHLVANFYALDFDTYCPILWDNTLLLNLRLLNEDGYDVTGCRWFKNDFELFELNTMNEFSYSAGPLATDLLELSPTFYMFQLMTDNFGPLCSTKKNITEYMFTHDFGKLIVYPNPVSSGAPFTVAGVNENSTIKVYNFMGACVGNAIATNNAVELTLHLPTGIYLIRADNKNGKIVIIE